MSQSGTAKEQKHYQKAAMQPIEVMQRIMSYEQFYGFLIGNYIKYSMRKGLKTGEDTAKDEQKALQYAYWVELHKKMHLIDPIKDSVPADYTYKGI